MPSFNSKNRLFVAFGLWACLAAAAPASAGAKDAEKSQAASAIVHDRIRAVDLSCERHQMPQALTGQSGDKVRAIDQEKLLLAAAQNKPFPKQPPSSLDWMQAGLSTHGFTGSLADLRGPAQMASMRIASLADNDYTIASQMAYGIHVRQGLFSKSLADLMGYFIFGLTENSDQTPENNNTNAMINDAMAHLASMPPAVKGYAKWALRAYAYDDVVAIDAAMAGVCMSSASKADMVSLGKAIKFAQFDPKYDYKKPKPFEAPKAQKSPKP